MHSSAQQIITPLQMRPQPIERWLSALAAGHEQSIIELNAAYREHKPTQGELIFTGVCEFTCQHCIYAPSFAKHNSGLAVAEWERVVTDLHTSLGIKTFVYGGRSVTDDGIEVLTNLRRNIPEAHIGLIDNGISMLPNRESLLDIAADWVDISFDGQEAEHDLQRRRRGSYKAGLEGALWLVHNQVAPKVNILSCLTRINQYSLIPMMRELNAQGFKNFFITPITVVDGIRPAENLQLSAEEFAAFIASLRVSLSLLDDAWVEVNLFSPVYAQSLARLIPDIWLNFRPDRDGLVWRYDVSDQSDTELFVRYYPISLTGTRELIVNTNGDVIVPKSMAQGRISKSDIVGNLTQSSARELVAKLPSLPVFKFYEQELFIERNLLMEYAHGNSK